MFNVISVSLVPPRMRGLVGERRTAGRRRVERGVRLPVGINAEGPRRLKTLRVATVDLSEGGLSVLSAGAEVGVLTSGGAREVCLILSLPGSPVRMRALP